MDEFLFYNCPANNWNEAFPIGNGKLGAMLWGQLGKERIDLNEETLWSGFPRDEINYEARRYLSMVRDLLKSRQYSKAEKIIEEKMLGNSVEAFQPAGQLRIEELDFEAGLKLLNYKRTLDLKKGLYEVTYQYAEELVKRESFTSIDFEVLAYHWQTTKKHDFQIQFITPHPHSFKSPLANELIIEAQLPSRVVDNYKEDHPEAVLYEKKLGLRFVVRLKLIEVKAEAVVYEDKGLLKLKGASDFVLLLSLKSNFVDFKTIPENESVLPLMKTYEVLHKASQEGYATLKKEHLNKHKKLFGRVSICLGRAKEQTVSLDLRLKSYQANKPDLNLVALAFNYGRYLLIASSYSCLLPANLQGLWNPHVMPPWFCDYTLNINLEMNYWPALVCNLTECLKPLINFIQNLAIKGSRTAKIHYGCRGWCAHHNSDIWCKTTPTDGEAVWAFWPLAGVWLCRHLWEYYQFTEDLNFLKQVAWPVIRGAVQFCLDWLVEDENCEFQTMPSTSPENKFITPKAEICATGISSASDIQLIKDLFQIAEASCIELQERLFLTEIDVSFKIEIQKAIKKLPALRIDTEGCLAEWQESLVEFEKGHRHFSHLYGLYPADLFLTDKKYLRAAQKALEKRLAAGSASTGWSVAWAIALLARLGLAEKAYELIKKFLRQFTLPNLLASHPPFQIDGNFGFCAGVAEMLLQSEPGVLKILPALPKAWSEGEVKGLKAKGGYLLAIRWAEHSLELLTIKSKKNGIVKVVYRGKEVKLSFKENEVIKLNHNLQVNRGVL